MNNHWGDLHVSLRRFKNLDGRLVVYGGFPESQLKKYLPEAQETEWGYEGDCEKVCDESYQSWFKKVTMNLPVSEKENSLHSVNELNEKVLYFNPQLCHFLDSWQPGRFPRSVDDGFLMALKNILQSME